MLKDWTLSEKINSVSVNAEVFFTRLIMKADDYGSFHGNPKILKANLFPLRLDAVRDADISRWLTECEKAGLILIYTASGKQYLRIIDFDQRLRAMKSKFPNPPTIDSSVRTNVGEVRPEEEEKKEVEEETEVEGGEPPTLPPKEKKGKYGSRQNVKLTDDELERLKKEFTGGLAEAAIEHLSTYKVEKDYKTKDDNLTIRRWVINAVKEKRQKDGTKENIGNAPATDTYAGFQ